MIVRKNGRGFDCIAVDLNTQRDFCEPDGGNPVANRETLIPALQRLMAWVRARETPVVSSVDSHRTAEMPNGHPICCIDGSIGQRKLDFTVFPQCARIEFDNTHCVPLDLFDTHQQLIFRQRAGDLLTNPKADRFLTHVSAAEFVLFGNTLEGAVKALALGLRAREKRVTIVHDGCGYWDRASADLAMRQMVAKGATLITVDELLARNGGSAPLNGGGKTNGAMTKLNGHDGAHMNGHCHGNGHHDGNGHSTNGNGVAHGNGHATNGHLPRARSDSTIPNPPDEQGDD